MIRTFDVYAKTLGTPVRTILFSIFTSKQKPPSLSLLPLHLPFRSSSVTPSRYFSNVLAVSNSPIHGFRGSQNFGSLFTVRAISSSPAASVQPQPNQHHPGEWSETGPSSEVGDGNYGGLEEETKLSLPVRAYFFSTRYRFSPFSQIVDAIYVILVGIMIGLDI